MTVSTFSRVLVGAFFYGRASTLCATRGIWCCMATDALEHRLTTARENLARLDRERVAAAVEVKAFEEALRLVTQDDTPKLPVPVPLAMAGRPRKSGKDVLWLQILGELPGPSQTFNYDDILTAAALHGVEITREYMRTKMMDLRREGFVETERQGVFRTTAKAQEPPSAEAKEGSMS